MIKDRHCDVAETIIEGIAHDQAPCFQAVRSCERALNDAGLSPSWRDMSESPPRRESQPEPNGVKFGWQGAANMSVEEQFHSRHWEQLPPPDRALIRSQRGPLASAALTALPTCRATRIESQPFRVWLCRRLRLPLPLTSRNCRCGRRLDKFGHHRTAFSRAGVLGTRGYPLECAAAQVCREAGGRVTTNVLIRDLERC